MAIVKPFKAWRPKQDQAKGISSVPYDVISTMEAKKLANGNPNSFLNVIRPEITLPDSINIYDDQVYQKGKENLKSLLHSDSYFQEKNESLYVYRIGSNTHSQTGIFGCVSVEDYDNGIILKHELTRPDKEDDRTRHIFTQRAHAEPVMLTFDDTENISELIKRTTDTAPVYDFVIEDGTSHTIWEIIDSKELEMAFKKIPEIYIADGHHRCASASRVAQQMKNQGSNLNGTQEYNFFPAVLFPKNEVNILPYNRIIYCLPEDFFEKINNVFNLKINASPQPVKKGDVSLYHAGKWFCLSLPKSQKEERNAQLDVSRLQEFLLEPFLNITNQRTDENLYFIGGIRGAKELETIVDSGHAELAISLFPTSINDLTEVSDAGLLMPPKSTWFEPKLRSGLLIHTF